MITVLFNGRRPLVTVFRDGWFCVGCYMDASLQFGDKYGSGKLKHKCPSNVSIARYSERTWKDR